MTAEPWEETRMLVLQCMDAVGVYVLICMYTYVCVCVLKHIILPELLKLIACSDKKGQLCGKEMLVWNCENNQVFWTPLICIKSRKIKLFISPSLPVNWVIMKCKYLAVFLSLLLEQNMLHNSLYTINPTTEITKNNSVSACHIFSMSLEVSIHGSWILNEFLKRL